MTGAGAIRLSSVGKVMCPEPATGSWTSLTGFGSSTTSIGSITSVGSTTNGVGVGVTTSIAGSSTSIMGSATSITGSSVTSLETFKIEFSSVMVEAWSSTGAKPSTNASSWQIANEETARASSMGKNVFFMTLSLATIGGIFLTIDASTSV